MATFIEMKQRRGVENDAIGRQKIYKWRLSQQRLSKGEHNVLVGVYIHIQIYVGRRMHVSTIQFSLNILCQK